MIKVIANLSPTHFDQAYDYFTFEKIRMHDRSKYRFILIYLQQRSDLPNRMEADGFPCFYLFEKHQKVRLFPAVFKLVKLLKEYQVDLIHAHNRACIVCAVWAALFTGNTKVLAHVHCFNLVRKLKRKLFYRLLGWRIDCMAGCSEATTGFLKRRVRGVAPEKMITIPNSINVVRYSAPNSEAQTVRSEWELTPDHFVFIGLGRLAAEKGFHHLIRAFKTVHAKCPNARLIIAGEGPERNRLLQLIQTLELQSAVFPVGFRRDVSRLLHAADCFVLSSLKETFGLVVLEAIAAKCPVIATDCGGVKEIISSSDYGILIPPGDEAALSREMLQMTRQDQAVRDLMTRQALRVFDRFSHENAVAVTEQLYSRILGESE